MSPVVKFTEGADFAFGARWSLMQFHPWSTRNYFLEMSDEEVKKYFREWRKSQQCPWYVKEQYLEENGRRVRGGAGPTGKNSNRQGKDTGALAPDVYKAKITAMLENSDYAGAASLKNQQDLALRAAEPPREGASDDEANVAGSDTENSSNTEAESDKENDEDTRTLKLLYKGNMQDSSRQEKQNKKAMVYNKKHNCYRNTRCTSTAQEEQSALPAGVINVNEDSDDEDAYNGEQKEIKKESEELRAAQQWINQDGWDVASEAQVVCKNTSGTIHLRLDWGAVKQTLLQGQGDVAEGNVGQVDMDKWQATVLADFSLDKLDPTQRAFADRVLKWGDDIIESYEAVKRDGRHRPVPKLLTWLGGSAGSGKSTTLKTCVQHLRLKFSKRGMLFKVELTAYTGVAAFNIGFGARTACSAFQIFPNAAWKNELEADALRKLEDVWENVVLLIIDEISFIGRALFARMHIRTQQAKRSYFSQHGLVPEDHTFGDLSMILVGDFGQLEPIDDVSMCDTETTWHNCPKNIRHLLRHAHYGKCLLKDFKDCNLNSLK